MNMKNVKIKIKNESKVSDAIKLSIDVNHFGIEL